MKPLAAFWVFFCAAMLCLAHSPGVSAQVAPPSVLHLSPPAEPIPQSLFGMHIHRAGSTTPWPTVPLGSWRLWDAHAVWTNLEPQPGRWDFSNLDLFLSLAQQHHVPVILPLALSPAWASARPAENSVYGPGRASEPRELADWDNYVRTVATRAKGKVEAYEIWNEPNFPIFWTGKTETLIELTRRARAIVKSIDPKALIVSPSATASRDGNTWLNEFLDKGGGQYVDVIGYHFYADTPEKEVPLIAQIRQTMDAHHVGSLPLWNTETGWSKPKPFPSPELGAAYLARAYILNWAAGVRRLYWYAWDNHGFSVIETTQADNLALTPAGSAYAMLQTWLVGSQMKSCDLSADHTWVCALHQPHSDSWIVWNQDYPANFPLPRSWHAKTSTVLNGTPTPVTSSSIQITTTPQLVTGHNE